ATRTVGATPDAIGAIVCVSVSDCSDVLNAPHTITFSLDPNTTDVTVTPSTTTVPTNASQTAQITLSTPGTPGSYTVIATSAEFATPASPVAVTVNQPAITSLNFNSPLSVGAGMPRDNVRIDLDTPAPAGGLTINLASTESTFATVEPSVVIAAGSTTGLFTVTGISTGTLSSGTLQVTASAQ